MGCCISSQKPPELRLSLARKVKRLLMISENREKAAIGENRFIELATKGENVKKCLSSDGLSQRDGSFCGKDEAFFDSLAWLESDTDDDFHSVRGDFTPSRSDSLNYLGCSPETPSLALMVGTMSDAAAQPSPKMKLIDLFRETKEQDESVGDASPPLESPSTNQKKSSDTKPVDNETDGLLPLKSLIPIPARSGVRSAENGKKTSDDTDIKHENGKASKGSQCCMPGLLHNLLFKDKKKLSIPIPMIESKA